MSKNAMAGAITLCGVGLCTIGGGLMMQSGSAARDLPSSGTGASHTGHEWHSHRLREDVRLGMSQERGRCS